MSEVYGPWEQAENSDVDEQKSGSGDQHQAEDEDVYPEQQPKGDPDRPEDAWWEHQYGGAVDAYEELERLNRFAKPFDRDASSTSDAATYNPFAKPFDSDASSTSDAATYNPFAKPFDPDASSTSDGATHNPFADELGDSSSVSLSSHLTSPDPDDFDRAESVDPVGPPTPGSVVAEPTVADDSYQPAIVDPSVPYADAVEDSDSVSLSSQIDPPDQFVADDSYQPVADSSSFAPEVEFRPDIAEETDWNHFIG